MKIALFGADGQVGREAIAAAAHFPHINLYPIRRAEADLANPGAAGDVIRALRPDAVLNAAAWTAVDKAESQKDEAFRINADAVAEIAAACRQSHSRFVHISTDYVFSGDASPRPLDEIAQTGPLNVYGASKLLGEDRACSEHAETVVLRTSWVYSAFGSNFVKTMLKLSGTRDEISVVDDQRGGPTPAQAIAEACLKIAERKGGPAGIYHFQGAPAASWADFAEAIFKAANLPVRVNRIATSQYPTPARRPLNTVLDCSKIGRDYGLKQPDWRADLGAIVKRLKTA